MFECIILHILCPIIVGRHDIESKIHVGVIRMSHTIQTCSGITRGRVLSGELHSQRSQKLIYLHVGVMSMSYVTLCYA